MLLDPCKPLCNIIFLPCIHLVPLVMTCIQFHLALKKFTLLPTKVSNKVSLYKKKLSYKSSFVFNLCIFILLFLKMCIFENLMNCSNLFRVPALLQTPIFNQTNHRKFFIFLLISSYKYIIYFNFIKLVRNKGLF